MKLTTPALALLGITLFSACGDEDVADAGAPRDASSGDAGTDGGQTADAGVDTTCTATALTAPGCGNDPSGTWTYRAACGVSSGQELQALCAGVDIQATSHQVSGTLVLTGSNYTLDTSDVANLTAGVPAACATPAGGCAGVQAALQASFSSGSCSASGTGCTCQVTLTIAASETGTFTTAGGVLTTAPSGGGAAGHYNYCAEGGALRYREATDSVVYVLSH